MRVAMVILEYTPIVGGAQLQLAALAPLLARRGVEVAVLTRRQGDLPSREVIDGVRVHRLPAPGPKAAASLAFTAVAIARLAALRPDVIHAYSLLSPATAALVAKRALHVPVVAKVLRGGSGGEIKRIRRKPLAATRLARLARDIDGFVTISDEIDTELAGIGVPLARRHRIPNGVDTERFRPLAPEARAAARRQLGLGDAPVAVYCGRLVAEKRLDLLFEAWRGVRARHPDAQLCVVGSGPEEAALRRIAGPGVRLEGEQSDVTPTLGAADLFVLPSETEGLSNALLEAMSAGLPVVATDVGGAPDVVEDGVTGRLVVPGDAAPLRDALLDLLGAPDRAGCGQRARQRMVAGYSLDSVAERIVGLYDTLVARPRNHGFPADGPAAERRGEA